MLAAGEPPVLGSSGDVAVPAPAMAAYEACGGGEVGSNSGEDEKLRGDEGDRGFSGGNRWPRQETLALLKIRSDMDQVFRDSSLKGPLWEEVSRKLTELGYHRSAKKCKEKFENVYKYHKRTKDGRTGKPEGKHYKFFDQLEALDHHNHHHSSSKPQPSTTMPSSASPSTVNANINSIVSSSPSPINAITQNTVTTTLPPTTNPTFSTVPPAHTMNNKSYPTSIPASFPNISNNLFSSSTSSSTASDEESEGLGKRKRKWKDFFKRLTKEVMEKQEQLQDKFLEAIEKCEHERMVREETWRIQEMARINREHEILIQERSAAAAKDAAVIAFLQKISGQQQNPVQTGENNPQPPAPPLELATRPDSPQPPPPTTAINFGSNNCETAVMASSSRWPKAEVQALIKFRTELSLKYQENGPKGPLWEEISAAMRSMGYNRSAKRCKEKWENINKYFKKVRESNKIRSGDSKTCPYFEQLDALYKEKSKTHDKPLNSMVPLMVQPEQQWPLQPHSVIEEMERDNGDQVQEDEEDDDGETEDECEGVGYEIVANKQQESPAAAETTAPMGTAG